MRRIEPCKIIRRAASGFISISKKILYFIFISNIVSKILSVDLKR